MPAAQISEQDLEPVKLTDGAFEDAVLETLRKILHNQKGGVVKL